MSKLSFRARALDASKPLPVFRCEDLPDLHEYASINRAVPQMPTGMEKEEESVRVNSPVRPAAGPRSLRCLRRRRSADPHKMAAIFSPPPTPVAGRAFTLGPPLGPPADPGPSDAGPAEFGRPKGTKGSRDEAAGSHFVVGALGLGLVHP
uniref:Enhancer of polycomb homolog 1 n=1 Tax=Ovis aries TaxID=9940 RepID=A0AC11EH81_SHEEP